MSRRKKTESASSQTPTIDATMEHIESATRNDHHVIRKAVSITGIPPSYFYLLHSFQVALREQYHCAITKAFDSAREEELSREERFEEIPEGVAQAQMEAAHIIPFLLNGFDSSPQIVRECPFVSHLSLSSSFTERRCPDLGHASVLDANRLCRIEHQLSCECHLHDNG